MKKKILLVLVVIIIGIVIYKYLEKEEQYYTDYTGDIVIVSEDGIVPSRDSLPQNWSYETREDFWFTSQGAEVMPYEWFTYLEQPNDTSLFRNAQYLESFGYLPQKASLKNPSGLPIGFTITRYRKGIPRGFGYNCAACHTNQINYNGRRILVEGAPSIANFDKFSRNIVLSLNNTHTDDAKFERFAKNILKDNYNIENANVLRQQLENVALKNTERQIVNELPSGYPVDFSGNGRVDAFGVISNQGTAFALNDLSNKNFPNAPVSFPFLWGTHQSDVVQWNASAPNTPVIGPLVRNIGEVVGVYGGLEIESNGKKDSYTSTVDYQGLGQLESWVKHLRSPEWPAYFPQIDNEKAAKGGVLFAKNCASCHQVIPRNQEANRYVANKTPISELGTDSLTAANIANHVAKTLILEGKKESVLFGKKFGDTTTAIKIPVNGVIGLVSQNPINALKAGLAPLESSPLSEDVKTVDEYINENLKKRDSLQKGELVYKGRPLNGIWATAPYLHNGSVPNLWELLKDPKDRVKEFQVGNREFDPVNIGFILKGGPFLFKVYKSDSIIMPGNSNLGHLYGTTLTEKEKWELIEYMKTL